MNQANIGEKIYWFFILNFYIQILQIYIYFLFIFNII